MRRHVHRLRRWRVPSCCESRCAFRGRHKIENNEHDYRMKKNGQRSASTSKRVNKKFNTIAHTFNNEPIYTCDRRILENVSCICVIHTRMVWMCACDITTLPASTATGAHNKQRRDEADRCSVQGQQNCVSPKKAFVPVPRSQFKWARFNTEKEVVLHSCSAYQRSVTFAFIWLL